MNSDHRALLEYVDNVIGEQLHDLDPARVHGRARLHAMLRRSTRTKEHDVAFVPYGRFRRATP